MTTLEKGWPKLYICTVYDRYFHAKNTVHRIYLKMYGCQVAFMRPSLYRQWHGMVVMVKFMVHAKGKNGNKGGETRAVQ
jgi:hypothetical protein